MNRRNSGFLPLSALFLAILLIAGCGSESTSTGPGGDDDPSGPRVWYVDNEAMGSGDGGSWENAFVHPSEAMDASTAGDQIWVASGTYYGPGDKLTPVVAFKGGVALYGGFTGDETELSQRDSQYRAEFDGGDTLYHVVTGADNALLDRILIINGNAMDPSSDPEMRGGGIYCLNSKMRISHCVFNFNEAYFGGAIFAEGDTVVIDSCSIVGNRSNGISAGESAGGGGVNIFNGRVEITRSAISGNISGNNGGGLLLFNSSADFNGAIFGNNSAEGYNSHGGGIFVYNEEIGELRTEFVDCLFDRNIAIKGGGIAVHQANIEFSSCTFHYNDGTTSGSALFLTYCSYVMEHCTLHHNGASALLSLFPTGAAPPRIFNCLFYENGDSDLLGGAIYNEGGSPEIDFCTIADNNAREGAGIFSRLPLSRPVVTNSILWGNISAVGPPQIQNADGANTSVTTTDIDQDGFAEVNLFNLRSDPLFAIDIMYERYFLSHAAAGQASDSPCIDKATGTPEMHGLNETTTRTDYTFDTLTADMGFHHKAPDTD